MMIAIWHLLIKNIHIVMCIFKNSMASMLKVLIPGAECGLDMVPGFHTELSGHSQVRLLSLC